MFNLFKIVPSINTDELKAKLKENITLIDVRTPQEFTMGHIAKARNIPLDKIQTYADPSQKQVYVICQSGGRSKQAAKALIKLGYDAVNVRGGLSSWSGGLTRGK